MFSSNDVDLNDHRVLSERLQKVSNEQLLCMTLQPRPNDGSHSVSDQARGPRNQKYPLRQPKSFSEEGHQSHKDKLKTPNPVPHLHQPSYLPAPSPANRRRPHPRISLPQSLLPLRASHPLESNPRRPSPSRPRTNPHAIPGPGRPRRRQFTHINDPSLPHWPAQYPRRAAHCFCKRVGRTAAVQGTAVSPDGVSSQRVRTGCEVGRGLGGGG